jgi:hypothetical protein
LVSNWSPLNERIPLFEKGTLVQYDISNDPNG